MANYTFSVDGQETAAVGAGETAFVTDLAFFDTDDVVTGGDASGPGILRFDIAGGFSLGLTGYPGITGFDHLQVLNHGAVQLTIGQDFFDANAFGGNDIGVLIIETGSGIGGTLDASALDAGSPIDLDGANGGDTLIGGAGGDQLDGGAGDDLLDGGAGGDVLNGGDGDDLLDGGAGDDFLFGGAGNDTYVVDSSGDFIDFSVPDEGTDLVLSSIDFALSAGFLGKENLRLAPGSAAIVGTGNELANTIWGNENANTLDGGAGDDTLEGGAGNDTYFVDSVADVVVEAANAGIDWVRSTVSFTLPDNVENLDPFGVGVDLDGTGNALDNIIQCTNGDNVLSGLGGNDRLKGGGGEDTLIGGDGNDVLNGRSYGPTGDADLLQGGLGDDRYSIDSDLDVVDEVTGGGGTDTVIAHVSHTLATDVERLILVGALAIDGTGNELANRIRGSNGENALDGAAGDDRLAGWGGADTLTGGAGRDLFDYDRVEHSTAAAFDTITDFTHGEDRIDLKTIDANAGVAGNQSFAFIGAGPFTAAGQVRVVQSAGETIVEADVDSDLTADLVIRLDALLALAVSDFAL